MVNKGLYIEGKYTDYLTLKEHSVESITAHFQSGSDYTINTLEFCRQWLTGKKEFLVNTSGSTGVPKSINIYREQMEKSAEMTAEALGLSKGDHALVCLNTSYIAGKMMLVRGMHLGMNLTVIPPSSNPLQEIEPGGVLFDFTAMVPLQIRTVLEQNPEKKPILDNMKAILIGGAPVDQPLRKEIWKIGAPVYATYGMTETITHIALSLLNSVEELSNFKVLSGMLIDQDDRGCLMVKGPVTNDQWVITNDIVAIHNKSEFEWLGRFDNVINSGGIKINPEKLERTIGSIFDQLNFNERYTILGLPDEKLGEKVVLVIESGKLKDQMIDNIKQKSGEVLSKYEVPREIINFPQFPVTETGKIKRKELKKVLIHHTKRISK